MLHRLNKVSDVEAARELADIGAALVRECTRLDRLFDQLTPQVQAALEALIPNQFCPLDARLIVGLAAELQAEIDREDAA